MPQNAPNNMLEDLLINLKASGHLAEYNLRLYSQGEGEPAKRVTSLQPCGALLQNPSIGNMVIPFLEKQIRATFGREKPVVCRLHGGLLSFLVPFRFAGTLYCLIGEGVREESINILKLNELSRNGRIDVFDILEQMERLPVKTPKEVAESAGHAHERILNLLGVDNNRSVVEKAERQLTSITLSFSQMDELNTVEELISFSGEVLKTLFDAPRISIALRDEENDGFLVKGAWGLPDELGRLSESQLSLFNMPSTKIITNNFDEIRGNLLPTVQAGHFTCFPLDTEEVFLGFITLFDCNLNSMDEHLVKLIINRFTARLKQLKKEKKFLPAVSIPNNLMSLTNTLVFSENKEELYKNVLGIAADLVGASRGSLMLIGKSGRSLHIEYCKGMNLQLARSISIRMGEGIAGRVASSGLPMMIDDIENDSRVGKRNRPRFKTKSLLSVPLKLKDRTIGVLNLSDKDNLGVFSETDMNLLASFANLASLMIERAWTLERSFKLEQLSVTDHLTGLYNRRFLRSRLDEELSRSSRYGLPFTVIFVDLDYFKKYNDLCGHLAGDRALQKAAGIIKAGVRDMDIVARFGGEEFCIILPGATKGEAAIVAERIRQGIEKESFHNEGNLPTGRLTASFGVASFPQDGHAYATLIHSADMALYKAKAEGRNRIILGQPTLAVDHA